MILAIWILAVLVLIGLTIVGYLNGRANFVFSIIDLVLIMTLIALIFIYATPIIFF